MKSETKVELNEVELELVGGGGEQIANGVAVGTVRGLQGTASALSKGK